MTCETNLVELRLRNGIECKPGITGLAQISGRDLITVSRKIACEKYYSRRKASFMLRLFIIYKTLLIVVKKTGISH
jgi:lipopolysaccharide/colanic/teichoic acid biosynthesis glycosyltransferase